MASLPTANYILHSTFYIQYSTFNILHSIFYMTKYYIQYSTFYFQDFLHSIFYNLHSTWHGLLFIFITPHLIAKLSLCRDHWLSSSIFPYSLFFMCQTLSVNMSNCPLISPLYDIGVYNSVLEALFWFSCHLA